jgi:hypothetical protein
LLSGLGRAEVVDDLDAAHLRRFIDKFLESGGRQ